MDAVRAHFRPEFINRVDDIIVFHRLSPDDLRRIVELQFAEFRRRLTDRGIDIELTAESADWLAEQGYDPSYGARPLKRLLQKAVADPLAMRILEGDFTDGDTVRVAVSDGELALQKG